MPKKSHYSIRDHQSILYTCILSAVLASCSFIELQPGAKHVIFANDDTCKLVDTFEAKVPTQNFFIDRTPKAIAEELQVLAQNAALQQQANAIWPESDIAEGTQTFKLLSCKRR